MKVFKGDTKMFGGDGMVLGRGANVFASKVKLF